ncbi:MAG: hypothetical protein HZB14_02875 [Actinobacteria bacterium]|nr:hypothetical protein [Actinomycetota bacterium]
MQIPSSQTNWSDQGYRPPGAERPLRLAFVGQSNYFEQCSLERPSAELEPCYFDHRAGADTDALRHGLADFAPDVVIVFRPEIVPPGFFDELPALTVGFLTEPLPRSIGRSHPDLNRRLEYLAQVDAGQFDRVVSFDPMFTDTVNSLLPVWRSVPLPVADSLYMDVGHQNRPPKVCFIGRSTEHRELWLTDAKHHFNIMHIAHGIDGQDLREFSAGVDVSINIHNEKYPSFENRVALSLASGHLVLSEQLSPTHGLEPDIDFVQLNIPSDLTAVLFHLHRQPDLYRRVRVMGRMKAEYFRASRVYPRLVQDLLWDFAAFGTQRRAVSA